MMKTRYIISAGLVGAVGATLAGRYFKNKTNQGAAFTTFEDAGIPDQTSNMDVAQFENAKMVSEGSQFGVNYYNEMKAELDEQEGIEEQ